MTGRSDLMELLDWSRDLGVSAQSSRHVPRALWVIWVMRWHRPHHLTAVHELLMWFRRSVKNVMEEELFNIVV